MECSLLGFLSMGFFRQEYWSVLAFPSLEDLPDPGIEPVSPVSSALQADSLLAELLGKPCIYVYIYIHSQFLKLTVFKELA